MSQPRVLYFTSAVEDYLSDSLLHGLKSVLGTEVVDFPKNEIIYSSSSEELRAAGHGRGFTLYGLLEDQPVARFRALERLKRREFDLVVFSDIWRQFGYYLELLPHLKALRVAVVDGSDSPAPFPYDGSFWRRPELWTFPRPWRFRFFKREITDETKRARFYKLLPRQLAEILPMEEMTPIAFSIPEEKIVASLPNKDKDFPAHIVDSELAQHLAQERTGYSFDNEPDYYRDLQRSRFGITTKRAGWDCLRHYEICANGSVMCFRHLDKKPLLCAPHGLDQSNSVAYVDTADLLRQIKAMTPEAYNRLQSGGIAWVRRNSTKRRAEEFLATMGF
jgi:hypothetical protein